MIEQLVVVDGRILTVMCGLYSHRCAIIEHHHIAPLSWWAHAGITVQTPFADLCPSCHMNTHAAIDGLILLRDISLLPARCRRLARDAFDIAAQYGLTPSLTL